MFDRFTDRARKVMGRSRQEAERLRHDYIGTEHLLLALIQEGSGVAADVLRNLDVDPGRIREEIEKLVPHGTAMVTMGQLPFTPPAKKVLELALEEASALGHNYIGTEHLLLGLIREEGIAAKALHAQSVRAEEARDEVIDLLGAAGQEDEPGPRDLHARDADEDPGPLHRRARQVMSIAAEAAHRLRHGQIGPEHILLGFLEEAEGGELARVLLRRLRLEVLSRMPPGTEPAPPGALSAGAKLVMELAFKAAGELGDAKVSPWHLLLGLIRQAEGIAAQVLAGAGITADAVLAAMGSIAAGPARSPFGLADRSRFVMSLARQEAQRLHHDYVGTEHVLLGLVAAEGVAAEALRRLGVDPARVRAETGNRVTPGSTVVLSGQLPFTPRAKRVLELAAEEANAAGAVREEHLLLGIVREGSGTGALVLASLGVTLDALRLSFGPRAPPG